MDELRATIGEAHTKHLRRVPLTREVDLHRLPIDLGQLACVEDEIGKGTLGDRLQHAAAARHIVAHGGFRDRGPIFVAQPLPDAVRGMPLFPRGVSIRGHASMIVRYGSICGAAAACRR